MRSDYLVGVGGNLKHSLLVERLRAANSCNCVDASACRCMSIAGFRLTLVGETRNIGGTNGMARRHGSTVGGGLFIRVATR